MKIVKIKKLTNEEIQIKLLMLKAGGQFDDKSLKLMEMVMKSGMTVELDDKQVEFLESISLIEQKVRAQAEHTTQNKNTDIHASKQLNNTVRNGTRQPMERTVEKNENVIEKIDEKNIESESYVVSNGEIKEIDATVVINTPQDEKEIKPKEEQNFVPNSPEEIANMSPEDVRKMFYLTPERIIECMKRVNNGNVWRNLAKIGKNTTTLQTAIENAYRSCVYPNDLTDPNFLDERIAHYLPEDTPAIHFKELHMAALMGTYVGYHVEKNEGDINSLNADGTEKTNVIIVEFPTIIDEMPQSLKEQKQTTLANSIKHRIEDIVNESDSYTALALLVPFEKTVDEVLLNYSEGLHDSKENKTTRAYINVIRKDMSGEMENKLNDLNISMDLYGIDWENPTTRKSVIGMIKTLQGQGRENEVRKLVEEINMSFTVNSPSDLAAVDSACADLAKLSSEGIEVNIAFELSPEEITNEALQQELDDVVDKYNNISRDKSEETVNNDIDEVIESGVESSLETENGNNRELSEIMIQGMINNLSMSATLMEEIQQEREEDEFGYFSRPLGGGGF